jgi:hypothetical protein
MPPVDEPPVLEDPPLEDPPEVFPPPLDPAVVVALPESSRAACREALQAQHATTKAKPESLPIVLTP